MHLWGKRVTDLDSNLRVAVDAETQTRGRNTKLAVRFAAELTRRSRMSDVRAWVIASIDSLDMDTEGIVVRIGDLIDTLRVGLFSLIRDGSRAV